MEKKVGAVLVIGTGVSGMQASLDLAESGFRVYFVEKEPAIGGKMVQLDKTFPTGDCSMCTIAPKMVAVGRHPDIKLLTCSEVVSVDGEAGNFKVVIRKNPRYVDESKCKSCGECEKACPFTVPDEFNAGLTKRKIIYKMFPQAIPSAYAIDIKNCKKCKKCVKACKTDAIDHDMKPEDIEVEVGAIIVSTGYDLFDPSSLEEYGFGRYQNVLTNLQFERLLSASGPSGGHVIRPSDDKEPKHIVFVQCVGSRDVRHYPYCSQICCMASTKEAIIANEHNPEIKSTIFYMDLRAFGKGFQEYANKGEEQYNVEYIRSRPSEITEDPDTGNLILHYEDTTTGEYKQMEADMVVLAPALKPTIGSGDLAKVLGIDVDEYGYFKRLSEHKPFETNRKGIYINGACQGPIDIPDAVAQSSGAAVMAGSLLAEARNTLVEVKADISEKDISGRPRIGVFVCSCGTNIGGVVDVKSIVEYVKTLPDVVYASNTIYTCSDDTQEEIKNAIKDYDLNRVVVASCTPRTHESLFRDTCRKAGLNPYLFEMANIRDQCSWVHMKEPEKATEKARDLVEMAVAKSRLLNPLYSSTVDVIQAGLVIGGGLAGLTAAEKIAEQGFRVDLVEKTDRLGGVTGRLNTISFEGSRPEDVIDPLIERVKKNQNITIHLNSTVSEIEGFAGNFEVTIQNDKGTEKISTGSIVVATGSEELKPVGKYLYGKNPNVMTLVELEEKLKTEFDYNTVVMIHCVGARDTSRPSCSRRCCNETIKNAILLKEKRPDSKVIVLYRDMMTFGKYEDYYKKSQEELGVKYIRYTNEKPPEVREKDGKLVVKVYDVLLQADIEIEADHVTLTTPRIPREDIEELQKILKVPRSQDGFFMEAHAKLRPLEFTSDGLFLCGDCQGPKELSGIVAQAAGVASKVCSMLSKGVIETEAITSTVDKGYCIGCGRCVEVCPFEAISIIKSDDGRYVSYVNEAVCKGCGTCASVCPNGAIVPRNFERQQIVAMIDALAEV